MDRIDALRLLIQVADAGSFSAVARERSLATSTVTLSITQLEQEFGARLMLRSTRRLALTHEGELLLADARRIVADWDAALRGLQHGSEVSGPIRVTATNDFGRSQLRALLDAFQLRHPQVTISLLLSDSTVDLIDEHIDLALRYGPLPDSGLRARLLIPGHRVVCASPMYWKRRGKPARPADLAQHNCLVLARPGAPLVAWSFREGDRTFTVKVSGDRQASDGAVLREWAVSGVGVVFKNRQDIRRELDAGTLETALEEHVAGPIDLFAVYPGGAPRRSVTALVDFLAESLVPPQDRVDSEGDRESS